MVKKTMYQKIMRLKQQGYTKFGIAEELMFDR